jgi:hypothetical protein
MGSYLIRSARYVIVGLLVAVIGKVAWSHRDDDWIRKFLRTDGPAKIDIRFDNGSVRDAAVILGQPLSTSSSRAVENTPGKMKKCLRDREVLYTDQTCPAGTTVAAVNGGNVTVLGANKPKNEAQTTSQDRRTSLRDALDLSGNENIREKMMERAINK